MNENDAHIKQAIFLLQAQIIQGDVEVPVFPETARKVLNLIQDPDSDAKQLAKIIQTDPTLGGHVVQIANSAAYSPTANIVSIQQAVSRLGLIEISNIALSTSINSKMFNAPGFEKDIQAIWRHAVCSGLAAKEISRALRDNVETAFLCGLIHTIGKLVILQILAEKTDIAKAKDKSILDNLFERFEIVFLKMICENWNLPDFLISCICHYKDFSSSDETGKLPAVIAFSHEVANLLLFPFDYSEDDLLQSDTLDTLNLYPDNVADILSKKEAIRAQLQLMTK